MRLAIVSSHPIQYNAPFFRELSQRPEITLRVFYGWEGTARQQDPEFGKVVAWDIPLLEGYDWGMILNCSRDPGTHHFAGIDNPGTIPSILAWKPDAVLVYGWAFRTHLRVLRYFKGRCPVLFRGDSTLASGTGGTVKRMLRRTALRYVYRHVDLALYPGKRNREYLTFCGLGEDRMAWVPHAIDTDRFGDDTTAAAAERERMGLGISPDDIVFMFAGKFVPRKECALLIRAFCDGVAHRSGVHLVLAGSGPLEHELRALAAGRSDIHFMGFQNQSLMPALYRVGDCFVLPSRHETWGLAVNEAMAAGRPIITSDSVGAAPDLVENKPYGQVFCTGNLSALTKALRQYAKSRAELIVQGKAARVEISAWSIPAAADALISAMRTKGLLGR